jgi:spore germination cell wall hydrolase CwlJ-like protein
MLNLKRVFLVALATVSVVFLVVSNVSIKAQNTLTVALEGSTEYYEVATQNGLNLSYEEYIMLCSVVQGETGGAEVEWSELVAQVIKNRVDSENFPNDVESVLTQPNQFDAIQNYYNGIAINEVTYQAVANVFTGNAKATERNLDGAVYYCNPDILSEDIVEWFNGLTQTYEAFYTVDGYTFHHVFYK